MPDARHFHQELSAVDGVHRAVIAYAETPLVIAAFEFLAARRPWIEGQTLQPRENMRIQLPGQAVYFFLCTWLHLDGILSHAASRA